MVFQAVHSWSLGGLIGAFLDLVVAYILLCVAAFAYMPSKLFSVFGLHLPCPCNGVFGYKNSNLCWHRLLYDLPKEIIYSVQKSAMSKFPSDLICLTDKACNSNKQSIGDGNCASGVLELENEASCSSFSGRRLQNSIDRENGYDAWGKTAMNLRPRSGIRRRRKAALDNRLFSSLLPGDYLPFVVSVNSPYDGSEKRCKTSESLGPGSGREDPFLGETNGPMGIDGGERSQHSFELSGSFGEAQGFLSSVQPRIIEPPTSLVGNEANTIRMLELALEEEKAARSALYLELEKERAAAASAAEETIAMISRLQQDKASVEMESKHYHRMIEEKSAFDEEEMNILKEILIRMERENHFLEQEIEEYRQMSFFDNDLSKVVLNDEMDNRGQKPSSSLGLNDDGQLTLHVENGMSVGEDVGNGAIWSSNHKFPLVEKQSQIHGYGCLENNVLLADKEKETDANSIVCKQMTVKGAQIQNCIQKIFPCHGEELEKNGEDEDQAGCNAHGSMLDTEAAVYDIHVIDDENETRKAQGGKDSGSSISNAVNASRDGAVAMGASGVWSSEALSDRPTTSRVDSDHNMPKSFLKIGSELPVLNHSRSKSLLSDSGMESLSAVIGDKLTIDTEIERLRERLRIVQEEKENLTFHTENGDREKDPLRLLEEIAQQLQEIQRLRDPMQQTSLPPSSKVIVEKRVSSVSCEALESA